MSMSATPRSARLSRPGEVVAILIASAVIWLAVGIGLFTLFITVFIPLVQFGGRSEIPNDFPVYPGAQLQSATASGFNGCTTVTASWSTRDDPTTVTDFYKTALSEQSWTLIDTRQHLRSISFFFRGTGVQQREGWLTVETSSFANSTTQISLELVKSAPRAVGECHVAVGIVGS